MTVAADDYLYREPFRPSRTADRHGNGVIVSAEVADDGSPQATTIAWTQVAGPGTATIESSTSATTAVTFNVPGYLCAAVTATDRQFTVSDQVAVVVGSSIVAADWITQDLGPSPSRRGQGLQTGSLFSLSRNGRGLRGNELGSSTRHGASGWMATRASSRD